MAGTTNTEIRNDLTSFRNYVTGEFDSVRADVQQNRDDISRLDEDIRGNGQPGLKARATAAELAAKKSTELMEEVKAALKQQREQRDDDVRKIMWTLIGVGLSVATGFGWFIVDLSQKIAAQ